MKRSRIPQAILVCSGLLMMLATAALGEQDDRAVRHVWQDATDDADRSRDPALIRQRTIAVDRAALDAVRAGDQVAFELFDGLEVTGTVNRHRVRRADRYTLSGGLDGIVGGTFVLAANRDATVGTVRLGGAGLYRIESAGNGRTRLVQLRPVLADCELEGGVELELPDGAPDGQLAGECADGSVIDVLVVYTLAAQADAGGVAAMEAEIDAAIEDNNVAYANSLIGAEMNVVYIRQLQVSEGQVSLGALINPFDGIMDDVHFLRDVYGGDQVALIRSGGGGVASGLWDLVPGTDATAFSLTGRDSLASFVLAHEMGHNMGCCHAIGDGGGCPLGGGMLFDYSNGHRFFGLSQVEWRTVMAYSPGTRAAHFSNPDVLFDGVATGIAPGAPDSADNALTINLSKAHVANYRCADMVCESLDLPSDAPDCNLNGIPDPCDIALGFGTDINGDDVLDECQVPSNDSCAGAELTGEITEYSTAFALVDGFDETGTCGFEISGDVWFRSFALCEGGVLTVEVSGSNYDHAVAVYTLLGCPGGPDEAVACFQSPDTSVSIPVTLGQAVRVRVGGINGETGEGTLLLTCDDRPLPCPEDCGAPSDNEVDTVDLLALLSQWGDAGSCDLDGGGVSTTDLLQFLSAWGSCE